MASVHNTTAFRSSGGIDVYLLKTYEMVVYSDGRSAVAEYDPDPDTGVLIYGDRDFRDAEQTAFLVKAITGPWEQENGADNVPTEDV